MEVMMDRHEKIDYVEFSTPDPENTKAFFSQVFGWKFTDYGPDYCDSPDGGIMTGFFRGDRKSTQETGGALLTFFSTDLEATQEKIKAAGGKIIKPIFPFPGGRRFQFLEPGGNEFAVWSDQGL
ncbi:VOC family protein [Pontiellaceae bacterium B12227]|nr:VOC family protein [Pontiellaceae bacterium B12227]